MCVSGIKFEMTAGGTIESYSLKKTGATSPRLSLSAGVSMTRAGFLEEVGPVFDQASDRLYTLQSFQAASCNYLLYMFNFDVACVKNIWGRGK